MHISTYESAVFGFNERIDEICPLVTHSISRHTKRKTDTLSLMTGRVKSRAKLYILHILHTKRNLKCI